MYSILHSLLVSVWLLHSASTLNTVHGVFVVLPNKPTFRSRWIGTVQIDKNQTPPVLNRKS